MHGFITQMVPPCDQILRNFVQILLTVENICEGGLFIYLYRITRNISRNFKFTNFNVTKIQISIFRSEIVTYKQKPNLHH